MKIMFVCLGNVCRSPMAEYIMKDMLKQRGITGVEIQSAATNPYGVPSPIHPKALYQLRAREITPDLRQSQLLKKSDYDIFDYIVGMDSANIRDIRSIMHGDPQHKIHRLLDFTAQARDIADPYYTENFARCFKEIQTGCNAFLNYLYGDTGEEENE